MKGPRIILHSSVFLFQIILQKVRQFLNMTRKQRQNNSVHEMRVWFSVGLLLLHCSANLIICHQKLSWQANTFFLSQIFKYLLWCLLFVGCYCSLIILEEMMTALLLYSSNQAITSSSTFKCFSFYKRNNEFCFYV